MNDNFADGEDVSWYYDIPFENCFRFPKEIIFSGSRALDCALRLKYAGFTGESTQTPTIAEALDHSLHRHPGITELTAKAWLKICLSCRINCISPTFTPLA